MFLRAERTEFGHIDELVKSIALARTATEFRLSHNGKPVRLLKPVADAADHARRIADVLGDAFPGQLAGLIAAFMGMIVGSLAPQWLQNRTVRRRALLCLPPPPTGDARRAQAGEQDSGRGRFGN